MLELLFWILFSIVVYTYLGYAVVLFILVKLKYFFGRKRKILPGLSVDQYPEVCMFVAAYNEIDFVKQKVENTFHLNYPKEKIQYVWVTDGSDDGTPELLRQYPELEVYHQAERKGKMHAMNRGMHFVKSPIVIFSDSNTVLGADSVLSIVHEFRNPKVGCVAGEKRIVEKIEDDAAGAGESIYWRFESWIKKMDSELNSAVGAVGELFAIRRELFEKLEEDTLLDDFVISLRIAMKGYKIIYSPKAYAVETASISVSEEMKRKKRIAAGGIQTLIRLRALLNPFRYKLLSFQYISHKVLRWSLAPFALFFLPVINLLILCFSKNISATNFFLMFFVLQVFMYLLALLGFIFERRKTNFKLGFIPYYFVSMNYAAVVGWSRYLKGKQSVKWEKAKRA